MRKSPLTMSHTMDFTDDVRCNDARVWVWSMEWEKDGTIKRFREPVIHECRASCMEERSDWDYMKMPCGHIYHSRCLDMHLWYKKRLNCALCGDLTRKKWYCDFCHEDGHYKYRELDGYNTSGGNECFLGCHKRRTICKDFISKGGPFVKNEYGGHFGEDTVFTVVDIYLRMKASERFDWRPLLRNTLLG
jgi:hypothetical protein